MIEGKRLLLVNDRKMTFLEILEQNKTSKFSEKRKTRLPGEINEPFIKFISDLGMKYGMLRMKNIFKMMLVSCCN